MTIYVDNSLPVLLSLIIYLFIYLLFTFYTGPALIAFYFYFKLMQPSCINVLITRVSLL